MIYKTKFVSNEIISELPNWLIHFLWYLLEEFTRADPSFDGCFSLQCAHEGQSIVCQVNGKPRQIVMPCPRAVDCEVEIIERDDRLVMLLCTDKNISVISKENDGDISPCLFL